MDGSAYSQQSMAFGELTHHVPLCSRGDGNHLFLSNYQVS